MYQLPKLPMFKVKLTRRSVLKLGALTAAAVAVGVPLGNFKVASVQAADAGASQPKQLGFYHNQATCIGCKRCVNACKSKYKWEKGAEWRKLLTKETPEGDLYLSIACNHCADPACLKVCPVGAYTKRAKDGIVIQDPAKCVGCGYCVYACPYHAPQLVKEESGAVHKCNFCYELQDEGNPPACVKACPKKALRFGDINELRKEQGVSEPDIKGLPPIELTQPSFVIVPAEHSAGEEE